jgi:uncharacterized protein with GYD domain
MTHKHQPPSPPTPEEESQDPLLRDKIALRASQAGMRFIAQTHIYNSVNWERLETFIADSYHADKLAEQAAENRLDIFKTTYEKVGRMKVKQVVGTHEYRVVVVVEVERGEMPYFLVDMVVEEEYPHKVVAYSHQPLQPKED